MPAPPPKHSEQAADTDQTPMQRLRALDHLTPREAAKRWGVPKDAIASAARQIGYIREGLWGQLAPDRERCPVPVASFHGFPCKNPVEEGRASCAMHRQAAEHPGPTLSEEALAVVQSRPGWEELRERIWKLDKRALQSERLRLAKALHSNVSLPEEDYRLAALLLPSDDPATQGRRAMGLPGPNDGLGDTARLRGLGVLLAAMDAAVLDLPVSSSTPQAPFARPRGKRTTTPADGATPRAKKEGPLLYNVQKAAKRLGISAAWLRDESARGNVPYRAIGSRRMFSEEDLEQIVKDAYRAPDQRRRRW
ncbi:helix-turn-helix domain-containing protein [Streptomyces sp. NPDC056982]|uniref:helix-turn-helix domain-containing protein n=1 Tax=Streptomyces sp. NPDC056982 TaxID=3345986 RepID=UPI003644E783